MHKVTFLLITVFVVIGLYFMVEKMKEHFTEQRLAVPNAQNCDGTFTQDMYHNILNPFDWGFSYSTGRNPTIYSNNSEPRLKN